jgi:hypothetical protein
MMLSELELLGVPVVAKPNIAGLMGRNGICLKRGITQKSYCPPGGQCAKPPMIPHEVCYDSNGKTVKTTRLGYTEARNYVKRTTKEAMSGTMSEKKDDGLVEMVSDVIPAYGNLPSEKSTYKEDLIFIMVAVGISVAGSVMLSNLLKK